MQTDTLTNLRDFAAPNVNYSTLDGTEFSVWIIIYEAYRCFMMVYRYLNGRSTSDIKDCVSYTYCFQVKAFCCSTSNSGFHFSFS